MAVEVEEQEDDVFVRRGSLSTKRERELAKSRVALLKMFEQMEKAKKEAARSKQEAALLREHLVETATKPAPISFRTTLAAFTAVLLLAAVASLAYNGFVHPQPPVLEKRMPMDSAAPVPSPVHRHKAERAEETQFTKAIQRLQDDFDSLPGNESEIVSEINRRHPSNPPLCPLEWTSGTAALYLSAPEGSVPRSMASTINRCADAAEKLMDEKAAELKKAEEVANASQPQ